MTELLEYLQNLASISLDSGLQLGDLVFDPIDVALLVAAIATAGLSAIVLWRTPQRDMVEARFETVRAAAAAPEAEEAPAQRRWYQHIGAAVAGSPVIGVVEQSKMIAALAAAGIQGPGRLATFVSIKFALVLLLPPLVWLVMRWQNLAPDQPLMLAGAILVSLLVGWRLPDLIVFRMAKARRLRIELGIPDAMDLLVICAEAGLGIEQAIEQVGKDLQPSSPDVAAEFATTAAEMRVFPDRRVALENLAKRTGIATLRSMVSTLNQSMRYGTPLADAMRVLAGEMRAIRVSRFEERAARLSVSLTLPLLFFIMPCLFMLLGGPAALQVIDSMNR